MKISLTILMTCFILIVKAQQTTALDLPMVKESSQLDTLIELFNSTASLNRIINPSSFLLTFSYPTFRSNTSHIITISYLDSLSLSDIYISKRNNNILKPGVPLSYFIFKGNFVLVRNAIAFGDLLVDCFQPKAFTFHILDQDTPNVKQKNLMGGVLYFYYKERFSMSPPEITKE